MGDVRGVLKTLPIKYIQTVVTSPPYWGLRDYQTVPVMWGDVTGCEHAWDNSSTPKTKLGISGHQDSKWKSLNCEKCTPGEVCKYCGAWYGQLGLEPTPELYVEHLVEIFREVKRVLRDDGTLWLNLGDSYAAGGRGGGSGSYARDGLHCGRESKNMPPLKPPKGLKPKDLVGIPWMVAFALRADGWYLRSDIIWNKPNSMPESARDRPTKSHEYIFLLSKSKKYYYDINTIRGPHKRGRNKRSVWTINTQPYPDAHFATFPPEIPRICIMAGTSEAGCCVNSITKLKIREDLTPEEYKEVTGYLKQKGLI